MPRKIEYDKYNTEEPYHVKKPTEESNGLQKKIKWHEVGKRYTETGIRNYITTAILEGITLESEDKTVKEWIENEKKARAHSIKRKNLIKIINSNT